MGYGLCQPSLLLLIVRYFLLATPHFYYPLSLLTWRTSFLALGVNTHPLSSLVCYQLPTLCCFSHPNTPHRSSYNVYIDDINIISRPFDTILYNSRSMIPNHGSWCLFRVCCWAHSMYFLPIQNPLFCRHLSDINHPGGGGGGHQVK